MPAARVASVTVLTADAAGKISVIAIHHRPLPSALRFSAELGAELTVLSGFLEEVKAIFKEALIPTFQEEPGCEALYETGRKDDPHKLVFFEVLFSAALHEFHLEPDYTKRMFSVAGPQGVRNANTDQIEHTLTMGTPQQTRRGLPHKSCSASALISNAAVVAITSKVPKP